MVLSKAERDAIREARNEYNRKYYAENREKVLEQRKKWNRENPDKVVASQNKHWLKRAKEMGL